MKNIITFIVFAFFTLGIIAQNENYNSGYYSTPKINFTPSHSIQININDPTFAYNMIGTRPNVNQNFWNPSEYYNGATTTMGNYSISYYYHLSKRVWFGCSGIVTNFNTDTYKKVNQEKILEFSEWIFAIMPEFRLSYINTKHFYLYSGAALGINYKYKSYSKPILNDDEAFSQSAMFNLTFIGARFGGKVFGTAEFGVGIRGYVSVGIGYEL